jgi:hypothetical protein
VVGRTSERYLHVLVAAIDRVNDESEDAASRSYL